MWYRIQMAAADVSRHPIRTDSIVLEGQCLEDLVAELALQVVNATDQARVAHQAGLKMYLLGGFEIEQWTSRSSFEAQSGQVEDFRRAMRSCVAQCPDSSLG